MKIFKFHPPYRANGRTTFPETKSRSGVYLIKENAKLVYIGHSQTNLYKTLYRHFQEWNHKWQEVISYASRRKRNKYTVRIIFCTPAQAVRLERALVMKHQPRDNSIKYNNYEIDFRDSKVIETYEHTHINDEVPF